MAALTVLGIFGKPVMRRAYRNDPTPPDHPDDFQVRDVFIDINYHATDLLPCRVRALRDPDDCLPGRGFVHSKVHGWFVPQHMGDSHGNTKVAPEDKRTGIVVLYFHGNTGNVGYYQSQIKTWSEYADVLAIDYPGFGRSEGTPNENGVLASAEAAMHYALTELLSGDTRRLVVAGFSLGSGPASHVASILEREERPAASLVIEAGFPTLTDAAVHMKPLLRGMSPFLPHSFNNRKLITELQDTGVIITHSPTDRVTPYNGMLETYIMSKSTNKHFIVSDIPTHMGVHASPGVISAALDSVKRRIRF
jgi:pimeloyl-ACP methyl ester carboxylesterase